MRVPECNAACCDPVRMPPEQWQAIQADPDRFADGRQILAMLTPRDTLGEFDCANFDPATRLCRIYDERPEMCRRFPADEPGGRCLHCGGGAA